MLATLGDTQIMEFEAAFVAASCAMMLCDATAPDTPITFVNKAFTQLTGYEADEALGRNPRFLQGPGTDAYVVAEIRRAMDEGAPICRELINYHKDGASFLNQVTISPIRDAAGSIVRFLGVSLKRRQDGAGAARPFGQISLDRMLSHTKGYAFRRVLRPDGRLELLYISRSAEYFLGPDIPCDHEGFCSRMHPEDVGPFMSALRRSAEKLTVFREEFRLISSTGQARWVRSEAQPVREPSGDIVWDGLALDVTAEKLAELERSYLTLNDRLTGLPNRELFRNRLRHAIDATAVEESSLGVVLLDLDGFQEVNEAHGAEAGDEVLRVTARRLRAYAEGEGGSVARVGGDEFAILVPGLPFPEALESVARELSTAVGQPMQIDGRPVVVRGSVGAAVFPLRHVPVRTGSPDLVEELMKQAAVALQAAKTDGSGALRLYDAQLDNRFRNRVALRQSLAEGIAERQFELHYQPCVALADGAILGAEALVRWNHPTLGLQAPESFIPLAEASGLIGPLGEWVLTEALRQGQAWRSQALDPGFIAINLSGAQLKRGGDHRGRDFLACVEDAVAATGADPCRFEFELTESMIIDSSEDTISMLKALKAMGFQICIDDFGTGYATFRYLRDFGVDKVKLDRSFISRIGEDAETESIVSAMIRLARVLGAKVVAEGVETTRQRRFLSEAGCAIAQGYLFSVPVKAEDFRWMLERRLTLPTSG